MKTNVKKQSLRRSLFGLCLFAAVLFLGLLLCAARANAASVVDSGTCGAQGDNVKWSLDSDGVLTISGKGEMADYVNSKEENEKDFRKHRSDIKSLIIKNGVTSIGDYAFGNMFWKGTFVQYSYGRFYIEKVSISNSVKRIGDHAFDECSNLLKLSIPGNVESIGVSAFEGCEQLEELVLQKGIALIKNNAFKKCKQLNAVTIPGSVKTIYAAAFDECSNLSDLVLEEGIEIIYGEAFAHGNLKKVIVPSSAKEIYHNAFFCSTCESVTVLSRDCQFQGSQLGNINTVYYGYPGSSIEEFAKKNNKTFIPLNESTPPTTPTDPTPTPAPHTHTYGAVVVERKPTCSQTGLQYQVCTVCGEKGNVTTIPKTAHTYKKVIVPATTTKDGQAYKQCTVCGAKGKTVTIPQITTVRLAKSTYVFTGALRTPTVVVKDANGKTLKKDTDYKVKYAAGRKECGKYAVKVVFTGKYSGKQMLYFKIRMGSVTDVRQTDAKGIVVTWARVTGATGYEVRAYQKADGKYQLTQTVTVKNPPLKNVNVPKGEVWLLKIRAMREMKDGTVVYGAFTSFVAKA